MKVFKLISHVLATLLRFLISGLRPLLGPAACRYEVGCTQYALIQLQDQPLHKAIWLSMKRLLSCNPFTWRSL